MPTSCQFSSALIRSRLFVVLMAGFSLSACQFSGDSSLKIPKAIFIIVDGIPADLIETTFTPHLDELAGTQGYTRSYVGGEIGGPPKVLLFQPLATTAFLPAPGRISTMSTPTILKIRTINTGIFLE